MGDDVQGGELTLARPGGDPAERDMVLALRQIRARLEKSLAEMQQAVGKLLEEETRATCVWTRKS